MGDGEWWSAWADKHSGGEWNPCHYCGQRADSKDHLEARTWTGHQTQGFRGPWVWSCMECNRILGDRRIPDVDERRCFVASKLIDRYEYDANLWLPDLDGLEGNILASVLAAREERQAIRDRLAAVTVGSWQPSMAMA